MAIWSFVLAFRCCNLIFWPKPQICWPVSQPMMILWMAPIYNTRRTVPDCTASLIPEIGGQKQKKWTKCQKMLFSCLLFCTQTEHGFLKVDLTAPNLCLWHWATFHGTWWIKTNQKRWWSTSKFGFLWFFIMLVSGFVLHAATSRFKSQAFQQIVQGI